LQTLILLSPSTFVQSSFTPVRLHDGHTPRQFGVDFIAFPRFVFVAIKNSLIYFFGFFGFLGFYGLDPPLVPCLCLCLGFSQMTMTLLCLFIILHFSHIGLTDGLTFIFITHPFKFLFRSPCYSAFVQIVNRNLDRDFVPRQNSYVIHPQFPGYVSRDCVVVRQFYFKHRVGQRFGHNAFKLYDIVFRQNNSPF